MSNKSKGLLLTIDKEKGKLLSTHCYDHITLAVFQPWGILQERIV